MKITVVKTKWLGCLDAYRIITEDEDFIVKSSEFWCSYNVKDTCTLDDIARIETCCRQSIIDDKIVNEKHYVSYYDRFGNYIRFKKENENG